MSRILVVDDMAIFRDPIAAALRLAGYETSCAADGKEALARLQAEGADLILLDLAMPVMDGLTFLGRIRCDAATAQIPVILLSAVSDKQQVLQAGKLGVKEYLLKSRFSLQELLERIKRQLNGSAPADRTIESAAGDGAVSVAGPVRQAGPSAPGGSCDGAGTRDPVPEEIEIPQLLSRETCIQRAESALQLKTLSGVVTQVISQAASPRTDMAQLASLIGRDPMLSARVLQAANSAAYMSAKGVVSTIPEAVKHIGCATIRNLASALGIFEIMPSTAADGFNLIRCWQHSFGAALLCERLAAVRDPDHAALAHIVGLCHDLSEILFYTLFQEEYRQVLDLKRRTGKRREDLERMMLGIPQSELIQTIIRCLGMPDTIRKPIEEFHSLPWGRAPSDGLTRLLRLADLYANGALLTSSPAALVAPITRAECRQATGDESPVAPDPVELRAQIFSLTGVLARLSPEDEAKLMAPLYPRREVRIWMARHPSLSAFDPVAAAVGSLAEVDVHERLPMNEQEMSGHQGLVVTAPTTSLGGFGLAEIARAAQAKGREGLPVLWLVGRRSDEAGSEVQPVTWPVPISRLAQFVQGLAK